MTLPLAHPLLPSLPSANCLSFSVFRGGRGAKSYDCEKAWPSINHSILSGYKYSECLLRKSCSTRNNSLSVLSKRWRRVKFTPVHCEKCRRTFRCPPSPMSKKYNSNVKILCLSTQVVFFTTLLLNEKVRH
jgi:hypothetical protein